MVKVEIIETVKASQTQNGLRHSDYLRYRRYCAQKLRRLRKSAKFTFGRGKFQQKQITTDLCQDSRYILMLLYNAERSWSYAMQLRQHLSLSSSAKAKRHLLTRLRKAVKWSEALEHAVNAVGDVKSTLEAQAYKSLMTGYLDLEQQHWEKARDSFLASQAVYQRLSEVADTIEVVAIQQKLSSLEPMIRYCQHQLGNSVSTQELLDLKFSQSPESELLNAQIESLLAESRQQRVQNAGEINIKGKSYTVRNEKARLALQKAEEVFMALERASNKLDLYTEAFGYYDEACRYIKKDKDESQASGDVGEAAIWGQLLEAIQQIKKGRVVERNLELARQAEEKFEDEIDIAIKGGRVKGKPQEIVKIYDTILTSLKALEDDTRENEIRAKRAYYMSLVNLYSDRLLEAYALLQRCDELGGKTDEVKVLEAKLEAALALRDEVPDISALKLVSKKEDFPPALQPISCKPVFYDLAIDSIEYPNLQEKAKPKGFFSSVKGWFGR
ncbi:unnamed protein product [Blepharisma stoltei]|uniref:Signal recognition particle subunit SRP68 n=1 Tax=Blepharisma stoltei TaxID=1481888 RepID=A0AAU9INZ3_9CILI|nr:unnamed protein product [Blepharisma stoltei]